MSGMPLVAASGDVRRLMAAAPKPFPQKSWFDKALSAAKQFAKGEHDGPAAMLLDVVLGMVPVVGQVIDARDIILGLIDVSDQPDSFDAYFNLITALIGVVPGGGDAVKRALRSVKRGTAPVEDLLSMLRGLGKGNPEKMLFDMLDVSKIQPHVKTLTETLKNSHLVEALDAGARARVVATANQLQTGITKQFAKFSEQVKGWLKKQPNNAAEADYVSKKVRKQSDKPDAKGGVATNAKEHTSHAYVNRQNFHDAATRELNQRRIYFKGILGEHMADYWIMEQGWAAGWQSHDWGMDGKWSNADLKAARKLNDKGSMTPLWPLVPRGRGIDALWRTNGKNGKPYAVIEAKAYTNPLTPLGDMLSDTQDKQEYEDYKQKAREWTGKQARGLGRSKKRANKAASASPETATKGEPPKKPEAKTMQMSHLWIEQRIRKAVGDRRTEIDIRRKTTTRQPNYSRHVLLFSVPDIFDHSIAVFKHVTGEHVQDSDHAQHRATRVFGEAELDAEESRRKTPRAAKTGATK